MSSGLTFRRPRVTLSIHSSLSSTRLPLRTTGSAVKGTVVLHERAHKSNDGMSYICRTDGRRRRTADRSLSFERGVQCGKIPPVSRGTSQSFDRSDGKVNPDKQAWITPAFGASFSDAIIMQS